MAFAVLRAIEFHTPDNRLTNDDLALIFPKWPADKIEAKTGIRNRFIANSNELASDLAYEAGLKILKVNCVDRKEIDYLLFCTQSPDYVLPTTACLLQNRLGLSNSCGSLDFNLGCSGYVYGLSIAKGLIESGQCRNVLLLTGETYSKHLNPDDFSVRSIFGDGGTATWIGSESAPAPPSGSYGPFVFGTDGSGFDRLIVRKGSLREGGLLDNEMSGCLFMNGPDVYSFTLKTVPNAVNELLQTAGMNLADIDFFVFHQANRYMLENIRIKIGIPEDRFVYAMSDFGNTVSSTIPIAIKAASETIAGFGGNIMLVGFGVGYSWAATILRL
jgi:3-oxoacyl-[acyl-carrier-protein] synthase-3